MVVFSLQVFILPIFYILMFTNSFRLLNKESWLAWGYHDSKAHWTFDCKIIVFCYLFFLSLGCSAYWLFSSDEVSLLSFPTCRRVSTLLLVMMSIPLPEKKSSPTCAPDRCRLELTNCCKKVACCLYFVIFFSDIYEACVEYSCFCKPMNEKIFKTRNIRNKVIVVKTSHEIRSYYKKKSFCDIKYAILFNLCYWCFQMALYFCSGVRKDKQLFKHYALNVPLYTHFTSPIRRYADIIVHRLLAASLSEYLLHRSLSLTQKNK